MKYRRICPDDPAVSSLELGSNPRAGPESRAQVWQGPGRESPPSSVNSPDYAHKASPALPALD